MKEKARKNFFSQYEKRMLKKFYYPELGRNINYRDIFRHQIYKLVRAVQEDEDYRPFQAIG